MADSEPSDKSEARESREESQRKQLRGAMDAVEPIMGQLEGTNLRAMFALNIVKNVIVKDTVATLTDGIRSPHFELLFESLCNKFADLVKEMPGDLEDLIQKQKAKDCDCFVCELQRAVKAATDKITAEQKTKDNATH